MLVFTKVIIGYLQYVNEWLISTAVVVTFTFVLFYRLAELSVSFAMHLHHLHIDNELKSAFS